jgi:cytochrome d ubiquinol oxidase subunit II
MSDAGILDWFTVLIGLVGLCTLTNHGANYLAMKTDGNVQTRSRSISSYAVWGVMLSSIAALFSVSDIRPEIWNNFSEHWWGNIFPLLGFSELLGMIIYNKKRHDTKAFLSSALFIVGMLASTAFGLFPTVLPSSTDPKFSLTMYNTAASAYGLGVGAIWWGIGMVLAFKYFGYIFYSFLGKVKLHHEGY